MRNCGCVYIGSADCVYSVFEIGSVRVAMKASLQAGRPSYQCSIALRAEIRLEMQRHICLPNGERIFALIERLCTCIADSKQLVTYNEIDVPLKIFNDRRFIGVTRRKR